MKRGVALFLVFVLLTGCAGHDDGLRRGMALREKLLQAESCGFLAEITADYADKTYTFSMECSVDREGTLSFCVAEPESISGIRGEISGSGGKLTFDDTVLAFPLLADGEVSPVSAPWLLMRTLRSGYISSCGMDGDRLRLSLDDSYEEDALQLEVWLDSGDMPEYAEIVWQGRRVLTVRVEEFDIV